MLTASKMGSMTLFLVLCLPFALLLLLHPLGTIATREPHFSAIYQFGDSLSDTGNAKIENPRLACSSLPYGETFFGHPTGRCSNGRLPVDFVAQALQLPLLNPYLEKTADFSNGVNFAVAGATALTTKALAALNITVLGTNSSLPVQVGWFKTHLKSVCYSKQECKHRLRNALFLVGEIGGNDYGNALAAGMSFQDQFKIVPHVAHVTKTSVEQMIARGAANIVVRGFFPVGCAPVALTNFASNDTSKYDELGCIIEVNKLSQLHNLKLQDAVKELQIRYPSVRISYGDTYSAFIEILRNAVSFGFDKDGVFKTCCGDGNNPYNLNVTRGCGTAGVSACPDPSKRLSWDGLHLTQQAYMFLADSLITNNLRDN